MDQGAEDCMGQRGYYVKTFGNIYKEIKKEYLKMAREMDLQRVGNLW